MSSMSSLLESPRCDILAIRKDLLYSPIEFFASQLMTFCLDGHDLIEVRWLSNEMGQEQFLSRTEDDIREFVRLVIGRIEHVSMNDLLDIHIDIGKLIDLLAPS